MKKAKFPQFDSYACVGDSTSWQVDGFDITAKLEFDDVSSPEDFECYSKKQIAAWKNDGWVYVGIVLSVSKNGVDLHDHAASLWGVECNFPSRKKNPNTYLSECALKMQSQALDSGRAALADTLAKLQA